MTQSANTTGAGCSSEAVVPTTRRAAQLANAISQICRVPVCCAIVDVHALFGGGWCIGRGAAAKAAPCAHYRPAAIRNKGPNPRHFCYQRWISIPPRYDISRRAFPFPALTCDDVIGGTE
jgi:hypothetical protein